MLNQSDINMLSMNFDIFRMNSFATMRLIQFDASGNIMYIDGKKIYLNREYDKVSTEEPRNKSFRLFKRK